LDSKKEFKRQVSCFARTFVWSRSRPIIGAFASFGACCAFVTRRPLLHQQANLEALCPKPDAGALNFLIACLPYHHVPTKCHNAQGPSKRVARKRRPRPPLLGSETIGACICAALLPAYPLLPFADPPHRCGWRTICHAFVLCLSPEMRERDVLGGDERQLYNRMVANRKREQDIKVRVKALSNTELSFYCREVSAASSWEHVHALIFMPVPGPRTSRAQSCVRRQGDPFLTCQAACCCQCVAVRHVPF
jgi:hypothetical protein